MSISGNSWKTNLLAAALIAPALVVGGCSDDDDNGGDGVAVPTTYEFESTFNEGESPLSYGGQVYRHALITDITNTSRSFDDLIRGGTLSDTSAEAIAAIMTFYYENADGESAGNSLPITTTPATSQTTYSDLASGRDLAGKIAGSEGEASTQYVADWSESFVGWDPTLLQGDGPSVDSPDALVKALINAIAANASDFADSVERDDPTGSSSDPLPSYVTVQGHDLSQILQKFLLGSIAFSQGTDDYLDDDVDGKGLLADNTEPRSEGNASTALGHNWDEGFGYFGAARDYADYTDAELAGKADGADARDIYFDTNNDGAIDLTAEYNFGHSTNAAKRDLGVADTSDPTDFTREAFEGFTAGRALILAAQADGDGELTDDEFQQLIQHRDQASLAWEKAIAATAVHYINDTLGDMDAFGTEDYSFLDHAKHWSELKGFALSLQFNPRAQIFGAQFESLHDLIGTAPVLPTAEQTAIAAYEQALLDARDLLRDAYGFTDAQVSVW